MTTSERPVRAVTITGASDVALLLGAVDWLRANPGWLLVDIVINGTDEEMQATLYVEKA